MRSIVERLSSIAAISTVASSLFYADPTRACAPAPPPGVEVRVADEAALIVWDDITQTEHFIRRASFRTTGQSFGFIVPTPTVPDLGEANNNIFDRLANQVRPQEITKFVTRGVEVVPISCCALNRGGAPSGAPGVPEVRVLHAQIVAGYDAVVLEADNPSALAKWLTDHGYDNTPALQGWLTSYVTAHWKLTAFKIASDTKSSAIGTTAVRMSFKTEKPFFPYREPIDQRAPRAPQTPESDQHRLLQVFFVGPNRVDGAIGDGTTAWPGKLQWSGPLATTQVVLPQGLVAPANAWLTAFNDASSPRPGVDELYFSKATAQTEFRPPPIIVERERPLVIPFELICAAIGGLGWFGWRRFKRATS